MLLLPYGLADAPATRFPWTSLTIGLICIAVFLFSPGRQGADPAGVAAVRELNAYWGDHPYLVPPAEMARLFDEHDLAEARAEMAKRDAEGTLPSAAELAEEQRGLRERYDAVLDAVGGFSRRWGLVPNKGLAQRGWVTHMFLHADIFHIAGNLLFFALVGPAIESLLGAWVFALFYFVGGLLAAGAQMSLSPHSSVAMIGASGAIAACMGFFALRFAAQKVKLFYLIFLIRIFRGTLQVPAWICGGLWALGELWSLARGGAGSGGVAVAAHLGGFGAGLGTAWLVRSANLERKLSTPIHDREKLWRKDLELERAHELLARNDLHEALAAYESVLARRPGSAEATWGVAQIHFRRGDAAEGTRLFDRVLTQWLREHDDAAVRSAVAEVGSRLDLALLRPGLLSRIGAELEAVNGAKAQEAYAIAAKSGVAKAAARLADLRGEPVAPPPAPAPSSALVCALASLTADGAVLEVEGGKRLLLRYEEIARVSVGVVATFPSPQGVRRNVLLTDLVLRAERRGVRAVRLPVQQLALAALYPEMAPREAYGALVAYLVARAEAEVLPAQDDLNAGRFPRFADVEGFEAASAEVRVLRSFGA